MSGSDPLNLAVDDEPAIQRLLKLQLGALGYRVMTAGTGDEALRLCEEQRPDLVLLDILMPDVPGTEVLREIRERWNTPVLFVTAKDRDADKVLGLQLGADDYIVKPFNPEVLAARIDAVMRRAMGGREAERTVMTAGGVEIDLDKRLVKKDGELVTLTRTEWMLLQHLAINAGKALQGRELLSQVWGPEYVDDVQYLRVWVSRLRKKLEPEPSQPRIIRTLPGIGYMLEGEAVPRP